MTVSAIARDLLSKVGCVCEDDGAGGWRFSGPWGCGQGGEEADGRVWLRYEMSALTTDPLELARIASHPGPARIVLRHRSPVAELKCAVHELPAALETLPRLGVSPAIPPSVVDFAVGVLAPVAPEVAAPTFLRLAMPDSALVDRARATYLLVANARLRAGKGGWFDGPGLSVVPPVDAHRLARELFEVGDGLRVLREARAARSYLDLCGLSDTTQPCDPDGVATTEGGLS